VEEEVEEEVEEKVEEEVAKRRGVRAVPPRLIRIHQS
jgi:hypothetical protein